MYSSTCSVLLLFFAIKTGRRWMNSLHPLLPICWSAKQSSLIGLVIAPIQWFRWLSQSHLCKSAMANGDMYMYPLSCPSSVPRSCHWRRTCSVSLSVSFPPRDRTFNVPLHSISLLQSRTHGSYVRAVLSSGVTLHAYAAQRSTCMHVFLLLFGLYLGSWNWNPGDNAFRYYVLSSYSYNLLSDELQVIEISLFVGVHPRM